jgi:WD40 repeat protein
MNDTSSDNFFIHIHSRQSVYMIGVVKHVSGIMETTGAAEPAAEATVESGANVPRCVGAAHAPFSSPPNNTLRGAKWSTDGLCLLTASEDQHLRLFELPGEAAQPVDADPGGADGEAVQQPALAETLDVREGDSVYDYSWYPLMDSATPLTCCFASSSRDHPVRLWDAYTGECRASYVAHNHLDEVTAAHSLGFNLSGERIYAGYDRAIRIFDLGRPGRQCELRPTCSSRKARDGQRGIISCFAFAPDYSGLFAAGSFSATTGLYVESHPGLIFELAAHGGGVTQLAFSRDGKLLYSAARRDGEIRCWDVRMSCRCLHTFARCSPTNQRIGFELVGSSSEGLLTASQDGRVLAYSTVRPEEPAVTLLTFADATNAVTMHPTQPLLGVAVGERRFPLSEAASTDTGSESEPGYEAASEEARCDNGVSVWRLPELPRAAGAF